MTPCTFADSLTNAEKACRTAIARIFDGSLKVYRFANPGVPDCAVFDIGHSQTGDLNLCHADSYHWRATLEIFSRDHDQLQRHIMQLLEALPINFNYSPDDELRESSNVLLFRVAPEAQAIGDITTASVAPPQGGAEIPAYSVTIHFDVVFAVRFE